MQQCAVFGNSRKIISDKGAAFIAHDAFNASCKDENIEHITIIIVVS